MGDYATTSSISELMPQFLSGNTTASDTANTNLFSRHIDRAEGMVKSLASSRYDLSGLRIGTTTTNVPPMLRILSEDIACWYAARAAYAQDGNLRQEYLDKFQAAEMTLKDIRDGKTPLVDTAGAEVAARTARYISSTQDYSHVFNLDGEESWSVDQDQVDDMLDARG